jgi:hypothetical protein
MGGFCYLTDYCMSTNYPGSLEVLGKRTCAFSRLLRKLAGQGSGDGSSVRRWTSAMRTASRRQRSGPSRDSTRPGPCMRSTASPWSTSRPQIAGEALSSGSSSTVPRWTRLPPGLPMLKPWSWCCTPRLGLLLLDHPIGNESGDEEQVQQNQNQQDHHRTLTCSLLRHVDYPDGGELTHDSSSKPPYTRARSGAHERPGLK